VTGPRRGEKGFELLGGRRGEDLRRPDPRRGGDRRKAPAALAPRRLEERRVVDGQAVIGDEDRSFIVQQMSLGLIPLYMSFEV
jgi:hypothetical protein